MLKTVSMALAIAFLALPQSTTSLDPPPTAEFPDIHFAAQDRQNWIAEGWLVEDFTSCTAARDWITQDSTHNSLKRVVRITGGCTLTFASRPPMIWIALSQAGP